MNDMEYIRHLHTDRPAVSAKVVKAFDILWEHRRRPNKSKKNLMEALLTILEYCGDFHCQYNVLEIILSIEDVSEYKEWLSQAWFRDMPNTLKAFIDLKSTNVEDISNFLFLYNSEVDLRFQFSIPCCLLSWNFSPLQTETTQRERIWLHINCGTKTVTVTGTERIPPELESRNKFLFKSSEVKKVEVHNHIVPYGVNIQGISIYTSKGNLVVHPDPLLSDWSKFEHYMKFISQGKIEFISHDSSNTPKLQVDCNANVISDSIWNSDGKDTLAKDSPMHEDRRSHNNLVKNAALLVSSSQDLVNAYSDESAMQICSDSETPVIETCAYYKLKSPDELRHPPDELRHHSSASVNGTCVPSGLSRSIVFASGTETNQHVPVKVQSDPNVTAETYSEDNLTPVTFSDTSIMPSSFHMIASPNADTAVDKSAKVKIADEVHTNDGNLTAGEKSPDEAAINGSVSPIGKGADDAMTPGTIRNEEVAGNEHVPPKSKSKFTMRKKVGGKKKTSITPKPCVAKASMLEKIDGQAKNVSLDKTESDSSLVGIDDTPLRRKTRSYSKCPLEETNFKTPVAPKRGRKRKSAASVPDELGPLGDLPACVPAPEPPESCQSTENSVSNGVAGSGNLSIVSVEDNFNGVKDSSEVDAVQDDELPPSYPLSMPSLMTPIGTPAQTLHECEDDSNFLDIDEKQSAEFTSYGSVHSSLALGPPPAVPICANPPLSDCDFNSNMSLSIVASQDIVWKEQISEFNASETATLDSSSDTSTLENRESAVLMSAPASKYRHNSKSQDRMDHSMNALEHLSEVCSQYHSAS